MFLDNYQKTYFKGCCYSILSVSTWIGLTDILLRFFLAKNQDNEEAINFDIPSFLQNSTELTKGQGCDLYFHNENKDMVGRADVNWTRQLDDFQFTNCQIEDILATFSSSKSCGADGFQIISPTVLDSYPC